MTKTPEEIAKEAYDAETDLTHVFQKDALKIAERAAALGIEEGKAIGRAECEKGHADTLKDAQDILDVAQGQKEIGIAEGRRLCSETHAEIERKAFQRAADKAKEMQEVAENRPNANAASYCLWLKLEYEKWVGEVAKSSPSVPAAADAHEEAVSNDEKVLTAEEMVTRTAPNSIDKQKYMPVSDAIEWAIRAVNMAITVREHEKESERK